MPAEGAREGELAQLVADHRLGDEDRHVFAPIVDGDVCPTISGKIVEARDQVLSILF